LRRDTLKEIGVCFQIQNERTVRSVVERMRTQLRKDRRLARELEKLTEMVNKGQKSTCSKNWDIFNICQQFRQKRRKDSYRKESQVDSIMNV
jgi:hypothetical protein